MHEMSLCLAIIESLEEQAVIHAYTSIKKISLEIGQLAAVDSDALRFCFASAAKNTLASTAELEIITIPAQAKCLNCQQLIQIEQRYDACPICDSYPLQITDGEQMKIKQLEVW